MAVRAILFLLMALAVVAQSEQVEVIVPQSAPLLKRSFLFADSPANTLILLYEKRIVSPVTVVLETRSQVDLKLKKRRLLRMKPRELLRLAVYQPPHGIFAIVQSNPQLSILKINPATGKVQRFMLYTLEEARMLDRSVQRIDPTGLIWNEKQQKGYLFLNLPGEFKTMTLLAAFESSGARSGKPVRIDAGKGQHQDLVFNTCSGDLAAATSRVVRLLRGSKTRKLETPEEIAFDPIRCRYGVVQRPFSEIPRFYYLDASLNIQSSYQLPGGVAPQLISEFRNQVVFNRERQSFMYPTWADHQRLFLNEMTPSGIRTVLLKTPIDASSMSVATQGDRIFLLLSGLQFGLFERLHRLILVQASVP